eukprot:942648-Prorocentrum_minimum.AAC.1
MAPTATPTMSPTTAAPTTAAPTPTFTFTWACYSDTPLSAASTQSIEDVPYSCTGPIPTELGLMTGLRSLSFRHATGLTGGIPTELGALTGLESLSFQSAYGLTGPIPAEVYALPQLADLTFHP